VSDSVEYEIRLWVNSFFYPTTVVQIAKDKNNGWSYRLGFFVYRDTIYNFVFQDSLRKEIDWNTFIAKLDTFNMANVPSQDEIELTILRNGKTYPFVNKDVFSTVSDGVEFYIEIYDNQSRKLIWYNNPHVYVKTLKAAGMNIIEHTSFIKFVDYLIDCFDVRGLQRTQILFLHRDSQDPKRKRSKRKSRTRN